MHRRSLLGAGLASVAGLAHAEPLITAPRGTLAIIDLAEGAILVPDVAIGGVVGSAIFDTGAALSSVAAVSAAAIGLNPVGAMPIMTVWGRMEAGLTAPVQIVAQGRHLARAPVLITPPRMVWPPGRSLALAGATLGDYRLGFDPPRIDLDVDPGAKGMVHADVHKETFRIALGEGLRSHAFVVDTGSDTSRMSTRAFHDLGGERGLGVTVAYEIGESGRTPRRARFDSLRWGHGAVSGFSFWIVDDASTQRLSFSGQIGLGSMRPYDWTFATAAQRIGLVRNGLEAPAWCPRGVRIRLEADQHVVIGLIEGSGGEQAGLRIGDRIVRIDGKPVDPRKIYAAPAEFCAPVSRTVEYEVLRSGAARSFVSQVRQVL